MTTPLSNQLIHEMNTMFSRAPSMMRAAMAHHNTPARCNEARHQVSELLRLAILWGKWAGEEEFGPFDIRLDELMQPFEDQFACDEHEFDQRAEEFVGNFTGSECWRPKL